MSIAEPRGMFRILWAGRDHEGDVLKLWQSWIIANNTQEAEAVSRKQMEAAIGRHADEMWVDTIECMAREIGAPNEERAQKIIDTLNGQVSHVHPMPLQPEKMEH